MTTKTTSPEARWNKTAWDLLQGRKIVSVRYMTQREANDLGWGSRTVVLELDNGLLVYPSSDDEGNDAGTLFTSDEKNPGLPVLR